MAFIFLDEFDHYSSPELWKKYAQITTQVGIEAKALTDGLKGASVALKGMINTMAADPKKPDYAQHLQSKPVMGGTTSSKSVSGKEIASEQSKSETLHPGVFNGGMSITVEGGRVINLGNYETARIGVHITVPCEKDSLEEAYQYATNWVSSKIEEAVKDAEEGKKPITG